MTYGKRRAGWQTRIISARTLEEVLAKLETTEHEIAKLERALEQLADEE